MSAAWEGLTFEKDIVAVDDSPSDVESYCKFVEYSARSNQLEDVMQDRVIDASSLLLLEIWSGARSGIIKREADVLHERDIVIDVSEESTDILEADLFPVGLEVGASGLAGSAEVECVLAVPECVPLACIGRG